jgi:hypothetical protein
MMRHRNQIRWLRRWRSSDFKEKDSKTVTSNKNSKASEEDWLGELLVGAVKLAGLGVFRFALRWPDTATLLLVFRADRRSGRAALGVRAGRVGRRRGVGVAAGLAGLLAADRQTGRRLSAGLSGVSAPLAPDLRTPHVDHPPAR